MARTVNNRRGWLLYYNWANYNKGKEVSSGLATRAFTAVDSVTYGENIADWRNKISRGESATTALSGTKYRISGGAGYVDSAQQNVPNGFGSSRASGHVACMNYSWPSPVNSLSGPADQKATSKLLASYINGTTRWRGGNFAAEIVETMHLFAKPYKALHYATGDFFKKVYDLQQFVRKKGIRDYSRLLSSAWLSYQFVAKPLASDANDAAEALADLYGGPRHDTFPVKGRGRESSCDNYGNPTWSVPNITLYIPNWTYSKYDEREYTVRYYGRCKSEPSARNTQLQRFGLDIFDFLPAVWEAIPYSFLIDYFVNVNEVLDAMRLWDVKPAWLNKTYRNVVSRTYTSPSGPSVTPTATQSGGVIGKTVLSVSYVHREKLDTMPYPRIHTKLPKIIQKANIAALIGAKAGRW